MSNQQPQQVVIIQQPGPTRCTANPEMFKIKEVLIPAIIMLVIAAINLGAYIYVGVVTQEWHSVILIAFIFFTITAILCICVSAMGRVRLCGAAITWTSISLIFSVAYLITMFLDLAGALHKNIQPTVQYDAVMIVLNFIAMACDVAAMVLLSKCLCCRGGRRCQAANTEVAAQGYPEPPQKC